MQMEMIELKYGKTTARVRTKGAQIVSFRGTDGREVIWQADPKVWPQHADRSGTGRSGLTGKYIP